MIEQRIFLLSHMRANTSLIGHILGSHPEINGYYEMHRNYLCQADLLQQYDLYVKEHSIKNASKYLFDKILHNNYNFQLENFSYTEIKILVSIRSAEQTIKSILNLFQNKESAHPYANAENATQYYIERIKQLAIFCTQHPNSYYYYDADLIRIAASNLLPIIQNWLRLVTPLSKQYQSFTLTGKTGAGDSSENIKKGHIVEQQHNYNNIELATQLLDKAINQTQPYKQMILDHAIEAIS